MFTLFQNENSFIIEKSSTKNEYIKIDKKIGLVSRGEVKICSQADLKGSEKVTEFFGIIGVVNFKHSYLIIAKRKDLPVEFTLEGKRFEIHSLEQHIVPLLPNTIQNNNKIRFLPELNIKQSEQTLLEEDELECTLLHVMSQTFTDGYYASYNYSLMNLLNKENSSHRQVLVANKFLKDNMESVSSTTITENFCLNVIFGAVSKIEIANILVLIIQRRFTPYFGPRYRKRGLSKKHKGFTANSIEVEMIVSSETNTYSVVLHRGSIPIYWTEKVEDVKKMAHSVRIGNNAEPYEDTAAHYDTLLDVHGLTKDTEIFTLSLLRYEKENRFGQQSKDYGLAEKYKEIITHVAGNSKLNMHFENINILFPFDREQETSRLKELLLQSETMRDIFSNKLFYTSNTQSKDGIKRTKNIEEQNVLLRVNCIDSTDRTNLAVGYFLYNSILELCKEERLFTELRKECRFWKEFNELFCKKMLESGHLLAFQYVGSLAFFSGSFCFDDCLCDIEKCSNSKIVKNFIKNTDGMKKIFARRSISDRFNDNFKQHGYNLYFGFFNYQKRECKDITKLCSYEEYDDSENASK